METSKVSPVKRLSSHQLEYVPISIENVNYTSYDYLIRFPPLFLSVSRCNHVATDLLLTYGACPNIQDDMGNTPLHLATAKKVPCYECCYLLLKHHAR